MSLAVYVNANAQTGWINAPKIGWSYETNGEIIKNCYMTQSGDAFICADDGDISLIGLATNKGIFDYSGHTMYASIKFYKNNDLIHTEFIRLSHNGNYRNFAYSDYTNISLSQLNHNLDCNSKIIHHLKYVGSIRVIAPKKYSGYDFDITIPMNPNIKTYIPKEEPQEIPEPIVEEVEISDTVKTVMVELPKIETPSPNVVLASNICPIAVNNTPQTDEIWKSYENAVRYIKYNDASYLERTYLRIERLLYANKREMRSLPKDSNELKLKKLQIKVMKSKMEEIDNKYFELTNKYIYQG
jgi:hypothetical protein